MIGGGMPNENVSPESAVLFGTNIIAPYSQHADESGDGRDRYAKLIRELRARITPSTNQPEDLGKSLLNLKGSLVNHCSGLISVHSLYRVMIGMSMNVVHNSLTDGHRFLIGISKAVEN
jgi:hypothetical protein